MIRDDVQQMRVIPPIAVTAAIFTSSTEAEPGSGETLYNAATTYAAGDEVYCANHRRYASRVAANTGNDPTTATVETPTTYWRDIGATNKWKMFDLTSSSVTLAASPLTVVVTPGQRVDSLAFAGLLADSITVTVTRPGPVTVFTETRDLRTRNVANWYQYFFTPFDYVRRAAFFDIPPYTDSIITITITKAGGGIEVQACGFGMVEDIGGAARPANVGRLSFSKVDRNFAGDIQLKRRRVTPKIALRLYLDAVYLTRVLSVLDALDARVAFYVGIPDSTHAYYEPLLLVGFPRAWPAETAEEDVAVINLEVEEI